jgi:hypothetical protein
VNFSGAEQRGHRTSSTNTRPKLHDAALPAVIRIATDR